MSKKLARIVFLDDNDDLRELMSLLLAATLGEECRCFDNVMEFQNHLDEILRATVVILDINLGRNTPDGVDAFHWLRERGFRGKVLFFTGHARTNPQLRSAETKGATILEKPLNPEKLVSIVKHALGESA